MCVFPSTQLTMALPSEFPTAQSSQRGRLFRRVILANARAIVAAMAAPNGSEPLRSSPT